MASLVIGNKVTNINRAFFSFSVFILYRLPDIWFSFTDILNLSLLVQIYKFSCLVYVAWKVSLCFTELNTDKSTHVFRVGK